MTDWGHWAISWTAHHRIDKTDAELWAERGNLESYAVLDLSMCCSLWFITILGITSGKKL